MSEEKTPFYFRTTSSIIAHLLRIETAREKIIDVPLTPVVLASLRQTARMKTVHYSTFIEGNQLTVKQVEQVVDQKTKVSGRERDVKEVLGYYQALQQVEQWVAHKTPLTEKHIQLLHAQVMGGGARKKVRPTSYRDGQNAIRDGVTNALVYLPPEAHDVSMLMKELVSWINDNEMLPQPLVAACAHYQFATIHPYYDGNGRTARLLTTWIIHRSGYDLKGLYSLEAYYARDLAAYYQALDVGSSHNYYEGRRGADITAWVDYFIEGMAIACESVLKKMNQEQLHKSVDQSSMLKKLDPKQRRVVELFCQYEIVTAQQIGELFGLTQQVSARWCRAWVAQGFLRVVDPSNRGRKYALGDQFKNAL